MTAKELKEKYIKFFEKRGHQLLPNVSLVPEDDPSALFISAGMHPLVPYLLGQPHPLGKNLVSVQRCLRTDDIDNVGDGFHHTFFEMLGNWSLGDYWKKEAIEWSYEFLTKELGMKRNLLSVSCFAGDKDAPKDEESARIWRSLGIPKERIYFFGKKENWWGPVGNTGPCGPDSEMFIDTGKTKCSPNCDPSCQCGKYIEVWNDVFMQYNKIADGKYEPLEQKNVDTGMGIERVVALTSGYGEDDYKTELFRSIIQSIEALSEQFYGEEKNKRSMRIIADHLRAAAFVIADGVMPGNKDQGYVLRRLIRRVVRYQKMLAPSEQFTVGVVETIVGIMKIEYPELEKSKGLILETIETEEGKFKKALERGLREIEKHKVLDGKIAFHLYESYGIPLEMVQEIAQERGQKVEKGVFEDEFKKHQALSRKGGQEKFKGGLADQSETVIKYHTAAHLLQAALRKVLGEHIYQIGSNITDQRARFDFTHSKKITKEEIRKVEDLINQKIKENLTVKKKIVPFEEAKRLGALTVVDKTYPEKVFVYKIADFSREVCGGPHVTKTGEIGRIKIIKQEGVGEGRRRIYLRISKS